MVKEQPVEEGGGRGSREQQEAPQAQRPLSCRGAASWDTEAVPTGGSSPGTFPLGTIPAAGKRGRRERLAAAPGLRGPEDSPSGAPGAGLRCLVWPSPRGVSAPAPVYSARWALPIARQPHPTKQEQGPPREPGIQLDPTPALRLDLFLQLHFN